MRLVYLAAGAGGMYCGSCLHDNRLAATLLRQGRDVVLIPLYTPLRTDEPDASTSRIFYGGLNAYLQQWWAVFRHTPWFVDRLLDAPALLRLAGRSASRVRPEALGAMTVSVLRGEEGAQRKELRKLIAGLRPLRPDAVYLPNLMFVGVAGPLRAELGVRVFCGLTGEDIFLDRLPAPQRAEAFALIRAGAGHVDGFLALTRYYAAHAARHFGLPAERVHRLPPGIRVADFGSAGGPPTGPFTIGYLARVCREKGFGLLCEAYALLRQRGRSCRLRVAGYLAAADRPDFEAARADLRTSVPTPLAVDEFEYAGAVSFARKVEFLRSLHALVVPTLYPEAKGLYVLEALAAGVPVVVPAHGAFPELIEATGGGLLHEPGSAAAVADAVARLMDDAALCRRLGQRGQAAVREAFIAERMADEAWRVFSGGARERALD